MLSWRMSEEKEKDMSRHSPAMTRAGATAARHSWNGMMTRDVAPAAATSSLRADKRRPLQVTVDYPQQLQRDLAVGLRVELSDQQQILPRRLDGHGTIGARGSLAEDGGDGLGGSEAEGKAKDEGAGAVELVVDEEGDVVGRSDADAIIERDDGDVAKLAGEEGLIEPGGLHDSPGRTRRDLDEELRRS
eukprot:768672-Hanusia_phi.AAC.3